MDWDGDGEANYRDEWIELHNACAEDIRLAGWGLDDREGQGATPFVFAADEILPAGAYRVYFWRETGVTLNNDEDDVRLLGPGGVTLEVVHYHGTAYDCSYIRTGSGCEGTWMRTDEPSPGGPPPLPTAEPSPTIEPSPTNEPSSTPEPERRLLLPLVQRASSSSP